jgi:hypothetical protein
MEIDDAIRISENVANLMAYKIHAEAIRTLIALAKRERHWSIDWGRPQARNPFRLVTWTDAIGEPVKQLACHVSELSQVTALPYPEGAVAMKPIEELPEGHFTWFGENHRFTEHLKRSSRVVASWPRWKRNALGGLNAAENNNG